ncbi:MAG: hypothetical protein GY838_19920 [bacterium]|nr:hypothetical protein [bacterium]
MIYVVLGMHKSGTTLVSQIMHESGINMDDQIDAHVTYDAGNKYERQSVLHLNMKIIGATDYRIVDISKPVGGVSDEQAAEVREIIGQCNRRHDEWGFKDPRTCLTYMDWAEHLPPHRIIAVYRHPSEIWPRFWFHPLRRFLQNFPRAVSFLRRWHEHNQSIVEILRSTSMEHIVLDYRNLMTEDGEFNRLQEFVGRELEDRRRPDLYRSRQRQYLHLRAADWYLEKRRGWSTQDVLGDLAALRASQ